MRRSHRVICPSAKVLAGCAGIMGRIAQLAVSLALLGETSYGRGHGVLSPHLLEAQCVSGKGRHVMSSKSPRKGVAKKPGKSIKEKRAEKRLKHAESAVDPVRKAAR